jgi:chromosomal replication initiator protein
MDVAMNDTDIVSALRAAVADRVGKERFELWFGTKSRLELDGEGLTVAVPNPFFQQWLRANFSHDIERACLDTLGRIPAVRFRVDESLPTPHAAKPPSTSGHGEPARPGAGSRGSGGSRGAPSSHAARAEEAPGQDPAQVGPAGGHGRRRFARLDSFVVGPSNQLAHAAAASVARRPGELSPLFVYGPTGVGKTHLLEGVWTLVRKHHPRLTVVYLSAEQFTTDFLQALRGSGVPSFRRKYRGVEVLILDDLQFFRGKRCTQIELLYTVDTLLRHGRQLVLGADRPPAEISDLGPELTSRLASGIACRIEPPEYGTRLGIVGRIAERLGMRVPDDVKQYVASRLTGNARELSGALCRLGAASRALGKPITLAIAEEELAELIRSSRRLVRLHDIEKAMCEAFGLESRTLQCGAKSKAASHGRMLAMWLARKYTRSALSEISSFFGRRSHSTVISAQKRVDRWLADGQSIELADRTWNVGDAVQQVERVLRAG